MRCHRLLFISLFGSLAIAGCESDPAGPLTSLPRELSLAETRVVEASNVFAFDLLREVVERSDAPNVFLSPLSASMALGIAMTGADGETWSQMQGALGLTGMEEPAINRAYRDLTALLLGLDRDVRFVIANGIWADHRTSLLPDYRSRVQTYFGAEARTVDFADPATKTAMNDWVSRATGGLIDRMIEHIPADAALYLLNAIHFKGDWRDRFSESKTAPAPFIRDDGVIREVPMMDGKVGYRTLFGGSSLPAMGVELPYGRGAFTAVIMMPQGEVAIRDWVAGIDRVEWAAWMAEFDARAETEDTSLEGIQVRLPRFEIESGSDSLIAALRALGMEDAFLPGAADFSRMTGTPDLFISQAFQKTYLRVDEAGTEAAAATAVGIERIQYSGISFHRPFLFAIRERFSGTILFIGVIGDPTA